MWDPQFPAAPVLTYNADGSPNLIPNLNDFFHRKYNLPLTLQPPTKPDVQGIGDVFIDTQFELSAGKTKPINFGAKKGGGYLGYVSVKFANVAWVVDGDPNNDGDLSDARIAGGLITSGAASQINDDTPVAQFGQGGQGVWTRPEVYNGWVQAIPDEWKAMLTCQQREPIKKAVC